MLLAIQSCHDQYIIHRDVKMENFLVNIDNKGELEIKLSEFCYACKYREGIDEPPKDNFGSIPTSSPELLNGEPYDNKVDMWALGVILYELSSSKLPFYSENLLQYQENIKTK